MRNTGLLLYSANTLFEGKHRQREDTFYRLEGIPKNKICKWKEPTCLLAVDKNGLLVKIKEYISVDLKRFRLSSIWIHDDDVVTKYFVGQVALEMEGQLLRAGLSTLDTRNDEGTQLRSEKCSKLRQRSILGKHSSFFPLIGDSRTMGICKLN